MSATTFSSQTLTEKLSNLNATQQSIETLSHWCIFHRKKAKLIVETWRKLFNSSSQEQKISFLYLANDILQNSRRKGSEYVYEFWKVLPEALKSACENGDDHVKSVVTRLVGIWDERKVFGSRLQGLKDDILGKAPHPPENNGKSSAPVKVARNAHSVRIKLAAGGRPEKIVTAYQSVLDEHFNEDAALNNSKAVFLHVGKMEKEVDGACTQGIPHGSSLLGEVEEQETHLKQCIQQLESVEAIRANLISQLKEALQEQESKQELIHNQLQVARAETERTISMKQKIASAMIISTGQGPIAGLIPSTNNLPSQPASSPPCQPLEPVSPFTNRTISPLAQQSQPLSPYVNSFSSPPPQPLEPTTYFANSTSSPRPPPPQSSMPFPYSFSAPLKPFTNSSSPLPSQTPTSFVNMSNTQHPQPSPPRPSTPFSHTFSPSPPQPSQPVTSYASSLSAEEQHKKAVADMATKLAASTSSAQMLTSVLSSLAAEEAASKNSGLSNSPPTKRSKLEKPSAVSDISNAFFGQMPPPTQSNRPPLPFPPLPPLPPPPMQHYVQNSGATPSMMPYSFGGNAFPPPPMPMTMGLARLGAPHPPLPPVPPPQQQQHVSSTAGFFQQPGMGF